MSSVTQPIEERLLESQRDALLDFYLGQVVAHSPDMAAQRDKIKDVDDACDYLLLDLLTSAKVKATRLSLATNSLQQFINRVSLNIEPGLFMTAEESENWQEFANRYNYWSADRLLRTYPESYLEPLLRLNKTEFFFQLESVLNQGKITENSVQKAVLGYLNNFEDVSNLKVIAGYEDGVDIKRDKFFFVGRTRTQPYQYYWRSLNLSIRHPDTDALSPNAWSEWKPIDLPLGSVDSNLIRPVFLNNRLYISWTEVEEQPEEKDPTSLLLRSQNRSNQNSNQGVEPAASDWVPTTPYLTRIKIAYAKYDGSWSTPTVLREDKLQYRMTQMVAVMDIQQDPHNPLLALVPFARIQGTDADGQPYDYDEAFGYVCDTLLVEITDLPDDEYPDGRKGKYVGNLVWYYSREHKDAEGNPIDYRTMVLYPATREARFPIAGEAKQEGSPDFGKNSIKLIVNFVHGTDDTLEIVAQSDFEFGAIEDHEYYDGSFRLMHDDTVLDEQPLVLHEKVPDLTYPSIKVGASNRITLKAELLFKPKGGIGNESATCTQEFKIGMHIRELIKLNEQDQVQFLSFPPDEKGNAAQNIRLNTLFAKKLIAIASQGIPQVLSWNTQLITEQPMPGAFPTPIDLNGANGIYFWELFFHMPFLVAWRLNIEQRLKEATEWLHYIFNPLEDELVQTSSQNKPRYWNSRPIIDPPPTVYRMLTEPTDPDAIAASEPIHYRKAIFRFYIKNLLDQGDMEYRKLTSSARIVAKQIYDSASMLLGTSPDILLAANWQPRTLQDVAQHETSEARSQELRLSAGTLPLLAAAYDTSVSTVPPDLFVKPVDTEYLKLWQMLDQRLYNLRHNLTLDGKEFPAGLYDEPISPQDLLRQRYQRVVANRMAGMKRRAIPNYRFTPIMNRAKEAVETLIQYGSTLLGLLEKKDSTDFEHFRMQQQLGLYSFTRNLQQQAVDMQQASLDALTISRRAAQERQQHYKSLYDENISTTEQEVIALQSSAADGVIAAQSAATAAAVADMVPNIFGLAVGGMVFGGMLRAIGEGIRIDVESKNAKATSLSASENYRRRQQEWELQYKQADINIEEIDAQINVQQRQLNISTTQLAQLEAQHEQEKVLLEYYSNRFTNDALYMWMISQISGLYLQAYDAVNSLCLLAEASWQYETGQYDMNFVESGLWNDLYQGLLVGEHLKLALQRMDQAYLQHNTRRLEIVKTVSVKSLLTSSQWEIGKSTGSFTFALSAEMFLRDYPTHVDRRIKTVALSLPALLGPYEDVRASLVQLSNTLNSVADLKTVDYLLNPLEYTKPENVLLNVQANQGVVISTAMEDSGMFRLNFDDELFLPFEGTGAISQWKLEFGSDQDQLLESLSDVILHLRYTARDVSGGSSELSQQVRSRLNKHQLKQDDSN
ncbi:insecticidal toxin complex protein A [Xenorhabdus sp. M]|uniref:Insecticidal toxin complex protein A n=1 Tax=Xenorhabdus szentirmaii TaxID=290112 RepID=A0AAW3YV41_9GAMM|nr:MULTISPECIES: neuraminidase-like domain-containing protein [unclassified Xenorhabdus]MBD2801855.1 insecticidal toxin complex protein A [Xenorhabdus sp. M]MBD2803409.1 insecticidal toxin complex protein A [Xenorhabdus sp. ZM]